MLHDPLSLEYGVPVPSAAEVAQMRRIADQFATSTLKFQVDVAGRRRWCYTTRTREGSALLKLDGAHIYLWLYDPRIDRRTARYP